MCPQKTSRLASNKALREPRVIVQAGGLEDREATSVTRALQSGWRRTTELPDLRRVKRIAIDTEGRDGGLLADRGSAWPWCDGHICGVGTAHRADREIRSYYFPIRHPDSQNFDSTQVYQWIRDHITAGVSFVTQNGIFDWGWLRA